MSGVLEIVLRREKVPRLISIRFLSGDMTAAVEVDDETASHLEELQAEIHLRTGREVTHHEIVRRLVEDAYESKSAVVDSLREPTVPLLADEKAAMQEGRFESGVETDDADVDDVLYE